MDQETRVFLEERFRETSQKIDGLREEMSQKFDVVHGEIGGLREEMSQKVGGLREEIGGLREEMSQKVGGLREEMSEKMDGLREEDRLTRVMVEGFRGDVQLVAEGLLGMNARMARHEAEVQKSLREMTMLLTPSYQLMDLRVKVLEEWADRQARDVLEVIREKFGKRQSS